MPNESEPKILQSRYEIRELLGAGGAGSVYKGWDISLRRFVAIKRFNAALAGADDSKAWNEAMTLASLQHPNILTIHDFGVDDEGPFVVMEYLEGQTLDKIIPRGVYSAKMFRDAAKQMLEGLIAAHHTGLIHRDLKPQNIMVIQLPSGALQYKILDFGLAKIISRPTVQTMQDNQSIYGSVFYITPEQLARKPLDGRSDLYALGCVFYYMLSGRNAFDGTSITEIITSHIENRVIPLAQRRPDLPHGMCEWVMKLISIHPDDRPPSADEALAMFTRFGSGTIRIPVNMPAARQTTKQSHEKTSRIPASQQESQPHAAPPAKSAWSAHRIIAMASSLLLLLIVIAMFAANRSEKSPPVRSQGIPTPFPAEQTAEEAARKPPASDPAKATQAEPERPQPTPAAVSFATSSAEALGPENLATLRTMIGAEVVIRGRVTAVRRARSGICFDFAKKRSEAASVFFEVGNRDKTELYERLKQYKNQMVRVRGLLEEAGQSVQIRTPDVDQLDNLMPL